MKCFYAGGKVLEECEIEKQLVQESVERRQHVHVRQASLDSYWGAKACSAGFSTAVSLAPVRKILW